MKTLRSFAAAAVAVLTLAACADSSGSGDYATAELASDDQKASYGIGLNVGRQIYDTRNRLDRDAFMRGIADALDENDAAVGQDELQAILTAFSQQIQTEAAQERARLGEENAVAGAEFQAENAQREGVTTTESGLQYEVLRAGAGASPTPEGSVLVHYRGTLIDGTEFDSSYDGDPVTFQTSRLITGFTEALLLMQEGAHYRIVIPSEIAYGPGGSGSIPPNATLIFEIELLEVQ